MVLTTHDRTTLCLSNSEMFEIPNNFLIGKVINVPACTITEDGSRLMNNWKTDTISKRWVKITYHH